MRHAVHHDNLALLDDLPLLLLELLLLLQDSIQVSLRGGRFPRIDHAIRPRLTSARHLVGTCGLSCAQGGE
jgi:hypothetical protein